MKIPQKTILRAENMRFTAAVFIILVWALARRSLF